MSVTEPRRDSLDLVEDEILLLVKDSEALLNSLKDLPGKEDAAKELGKSIMTHLSKVQDGLLDKLNLLADYMPYEQSTTQSRLKARQEKQILHLRALHWRRFLLTMATTEQETTTAAMKKIGRRSRECADRTRKLRIVSAICIS